MLEDTTDMIINKTNKTKYSIYIYKYLNMCSIPDKY